MQKKWNLAVIGSSLHVVLALLQLQDCVPPLQPGLGGTRTRANLICNISWS